MPAETPEPVEIADATATGAEAVVKPDAEPKGPPSPATPPAITDAVRGFEDALRTWWGNQDSADAIAAVGAAVTAVMVARQETAFEPPINLRPHFGRFRSANSSVVQSATRSAIGTIIPASASILALPHLPTVTRSADEYPGAD